MKKWTNDDLFRLDKKFAEAGIKPHQRPFRAAQEILGPSFCIGLGNTDATEIVNGYSKLIPHVDTTLPGFGAGIAASVSWWIWA